MNRLHLAPPHQTKPEEIEMESVIWRSSLRYPLPVLSLNPNPNKPNKTLLSPQPKSKKTPPTLLLSSFLKPSLVAVTAAAALLLSRHPKPSLASIPPPPPPATTQTLTDAEKTEILEEYLASHPDDVRSLRALMSLKIKSNLLPEAISLLDRILALQPDDSDLPILRCHLLSQSGDPDSARAGFEEIISRNPLSVEAYHGLVMVEKDYSDENSSGNLDSIMERIQKSMEMCKKQRRKEDLRDFKLLAAQIRVVEGRYEEALRLYEDLVREEPTDFRPYLCKGIVYTLLRRKDDAERMYEKYRRLVPRGHRYAGYFDDSVVAMKVFSQVEENRRNTGAQKIGGR
ncbi:protein SLOW GREEN 1, chloroplastic-like [Iris pallida]|uniref:Protein SLOW GREEN 1, chloroplastic-like n=1 Tax=Iris pallida TaxID=29817 RepID=A0AAX6GX28_IRIPA|nr:protein SLOW GREEN 1, chloroplastic-like [Iris pallida]